MKELLLVAILITHPIYGNALIGKRINQENLKNQSKTYLLNVENFRHLKDFNTFKINNIGITK